MGRKRSIVEEIIDQLKNISQIEHSRYRSIPNFLVNLIAGIATYGLKGKKPSIPIGVDYKKYNPEFTCKRFLERIISLFLTWKQLNLRPFM